MARPVWMTEATNMRLVKTVLPMRKKDTHKGDYGRVLLLCGSVGLTGAARLAARAALRCGSGLVYLGVPEAIYPIVASNAGSEIVFPLPCDENGRLCEKSWEEISRRLETMDAVLAGPGLGCSQGVFCVIRSLLQHCRVPLVLDADGLNVLQTHIDLLREHTGPVILTPHDGEFARLGGDTGTDDRVAEALRFAQKTETVLLLKGHRTIITDGQNVYRNNTGNPGMATGGSGDVLAGMVVSLLGQRVMPLEAAACAAYLHGLAGDLAAKELGQYSMLPEDLTERISRLLW